ncbi:MAG: WbqC family protein [Bacteroidales bacterium]|nr:WbqC family protein [Bacteroidales bacterium]
MTNQMYDHILLPTAYFPPIRYFISLSIAHQCSIESHETYIKQSLRNHCTIITANGIQKLSIPVRKPMGSKTKTGKIELIGQSNWNILHWRAIATAYGKSPFFEFYRDQVEAVLKNPPKLLIQLNSHLLELFMNLLRIECNLRHTAHWQAHTVQETDCRSINFEALHPEEIYEPYTQVFSDRHRFEPNLSILDLIFNMGPDASAYVTHHAQKFLSLR